MARVVPGASQVYPILSLVDCDVERMNRVSKRLYLLRRLRSIEDRIQVLSNDRESRSALARFAWDLNELDSDTWDDVLQLDYLETMRDAVVEALAML
jgi:hypothetical protein